MSGERRMWSDAEVDARIESAIRRLILKDNLRAIQREQQHLSRHGMRDCDCSPGEGCRRTT